MLGAFDSPAPTFLASALGSSTTVRAPGLGCGSVRGITQRREVRAAPTSTYEDRSLAYQQAVQIVLGAQREALVQLRREGTISNETMNRVIRELDLEESRLEI